MPTEVSLPEFSTLKEPVSVDAKLVDEREIEGGGKTRGEKR